MKSKGITKGTPMYPEEGIDAILQGNPSIAVERCTLKSIYKVKYLEGESMKCNVDL